MRGFSEALNVASYGTCPYCFVLKTTDMDYSLPMNNICKHIADCIVRNESHIIEGNNVFEVYSEVNKIAKSVRKNPRPVLIELKPFVAVVMKSWWYKICS